MQQRVNPTEIDGIYTIGKFADLFDVSHKTLRFYEERELLRPYRRGYLRMFTEKDRLRMSVIVKAKRLGFSLAEIWRLLQVQDGADGKRCQASDLFISKDQVLRQLEILISERSRVTNALTELRGLLDDQQSPPAQRG